MERYIHGYSDRLSVVPGSTIDFMVSCVGEDEFTADIVRLIHGDENPDGPGYKEEIVETPVSARSYPARFQPTRAGSYVAVEVMDERLNLTGSFTLIAYICSTTPTKSRQAVMAKWTDDRQAGYGLFLKNGRLCLQVGDGNGQSWSVESNQALLPGVWYFVAGMHDADNSTGSVYAMPIVSSANGQFGIVGVSSDPIVGDGVTSGLSTGTTTSRLLFAACSEDESDPRAATAHYNGKIDRPAVFASTLSRDTLGALAASADPAKFSPVGVWDFSDGISPAGIPTAQVSDVSGSGLNAVCVNIPARAMTGHNWTGLDENFTTAPEQYGAIHFHDDDLEDAGWQITLQFTVPDSLSSDVYAARLRAGDLEEYIPFFLTPPQGRATADTLVLIPTASYMAYANERLSRDVPVAQPVAAHTPVVTESDLFLWAHDEYALSTYDTHSDGSGVAYTSRLRPILNMRPKYRSWLGVNALWQFPADLCLLDWLNAKGHAYDVATDEDLDREGAELLGRYRVTITGSHPEYYSTRMRDGMETYVAGGGRLMYMGGNGFYWIVSYHPEKPHVMEVRKAESGIRGWQARPGEYHHSTTGERGGLWRNRGRSPQKLVGVGFTAQGFEVCSYYRRMPDSRDPQVAFIFDGIGEDELLGDFGEIGGGAAGVELDRFDPSLGTPLNALLLASSEGHTDGYQHVVEEVFYTMPGLGGTQDVAVRADMTYFTTPGGGAVFSTGSIAYCGSLGTNNYENNISRLTDNVLRKFLSKEPLSQVK